MHDYFDVIGLPDTAGPLDARRVSARYVRRWHPDFHVADGPPPLAMSVPRADMAVEFVNVSSCLDRIQTAFFAGRHPA